MNFNGLINKKPKNRTQMAWELELFRKIRSLDDGFDFIEFKCDLSWYKSDHQPSFKFHLILFNWTIFEFLIYNIFHAEDIG